MGSALPFKYEDLLYAPFVDGGRDPKEGLDCWGLLEEIFRRLGRTVPDYRVSCFSKEEISSLVAENQDLLCRVDPTPNLGTIVAMRLDPHVPDAVQHFGVMLSPTKFIHTLEGSGPRVTRVDDPFFAPKIAGFYQWK